MKFPKNIVDQKLLKSIQFLPNYSKYKGGGVETQCISAKGTQLQNVALKPKFHWFQFLKGSRVVSLTSCRRYSSTRLTKLLN